MRVTLLAAAMLAIAAPAFADDAATSLKAGQILRDANNLRLGQIDRVGPDGSVQIIFGSRFTTIPANTITVVEGKPVTSLTKKEVAAIK